MGQLYFSQLGQALVQVRQIQEWRATNNFGIIFWMYNEIWPTGGWGSIEYGGNTTGQVGRRPWLTMFVFFPHV